MNINNSCTMVGRLTKDPVLKVTQNGNSQLTMSIAVQRTYKNPNGQYDADFINCVAWGKTADTIDKYFRKGSRIIVNGEWRTGSYNDRDGNKIYTNNLVIGDFGFIDKRGEPIEGESTSASVSSESASPAKDSLDGFMSIPEDIETELPFV